MAVVTTTTDASVVTTDLPAGRYVDWAPIILGTLGALAIMVVLMTFGGALGLSVTSAQPYAGLSAKGLAVLAGLYACLVHVASFATGGAVPAAAPAPRGDLAAPIARAFAANANNPQLDARDRTSLASLVSQRTGLPQAEKRVDEAFTDLKAAEQKARDAADKARKATLIAGFLAAATMAIGAAAACAGAALGARHRDERTLVMLFGSRRFW